MLDLLPPEILEEIADVLRDRLDFEPLFKCALLNRTWALRALKRLYSIYEKSTSVQLGHRWAWRSIIASSVGGTKYPYCLWIKSIDLASLDQTIRRLDHPSSLRGRHEFFAPPLADLEGIALGRDYRQFGVQQLPYFIKIVDQIIGFIKANAEKEDKTITLTSICFRGAYLASAPLSDWISNMPRLTTMRLDYPSLLTAEISKAIRTSGAPFKEVFYQGPGIFAVDDGTFAEFLDGLVPDTLESLMGPWPFTLGTNRDIDRMSLQALNRHSNSLKHLAASMCLSVRELGLLGDCRSIVSLDLRHVAPFRPLTANDEAIIKVSSWLKECVSLKNLTLTGVPGSLEILRRLLVHPAMKLTSLTVTVLGPAPEGALFQAFSSALGSQKELELFCFEPAFWDGNLAQLVTTSLVPAICQATKLRNLDISYAPLSLDGLARIAASLPVLKSLSFTGASPVKEEYLAVLSGIRLLNFLYIYGTSHFSHADLMSFINALAADTQGAHTGIHIWISDNQIAGFSRATNLDLDRVLKKALDGKLGIFGLGEGLYNLD